MCGFGVSWTLLLPVGGYYVHWVADDDVSAHVMYHNHWAFTLHSPVKVVTALSTKVNITWMCTIKEGVYIEGPTINRFSHIILTNDKRSCISNYSINVFLACFYIAPLCLPHLVLIALSKIRSLFILIKTKCSQSTYSHFRFNAIIILKKGKWIPWGTICQNYPTMRLNPLRVQNWVEHLVCN